MKRLMSILFVFGLIISLIAGCSDASTGSKEKKLVIGVDDQFAPMGFRDDKNELVGFDIDYARAVGQKMGYKVEFQPIDWSAKESELSSGRIDLIWNGYTITDERKQKVLFTKPYLKNSQAIVTVAKSNTTKIADLAGKKIGLQSMSSAADALNANPIKDKIAGVTEYKNNVLALSDLKIGRTDAVVIDEVVARYYMSKEEGTFKLLDESLAPEEYGVGVKKGNEKLLDELQKAMDELNKDGSAAKISEKWFGEDKILK